jgi:ribosome biogenesis GTPase
VSLEELGWDEGFARAFDADPIPGAEPARIVLASAGTYRVGAASGEHPASLAGRLRHQGSFPAVGDWVALDPGVERIERVLPRRTKLSRKTAGKRTEEQVVAANVDVVLVAMGLDSDFNPRRVERFLATVWESGARPVVLLSKLDLCEEPEERRREVEDAAPGVPVLPFSSVDGRGVDEVRGHLVARETAVLVGSSGVGKSTLINLLLGREAQAIRTVRERDGRGQHTTSHRELFRLASGALLIDNPGVREIQLWGDDESLDRAFEDVARYASDCRFRDCTHAGEPGCAVADAISRGDLSQQRYDSYRALQKELHYLHLRQDESAQRLEKKKWRSIHREMRRSGRHRRT